MGNTSHNPSILVLGVADLRETFLAYQSLDVFKRMFYSQHLMYGKRTLHFKVLKRAYWSA
jgi:hypothetical protein